MRVFSLLPVLSFGAATYQMVRSHIQLSELYDRFIQCVKTIKAAESFAKLRNEAINPIQRDLFEMHMKSMQSEAQGCGDPIRSFTDQKYRLMISVGLVVVSAAALYFTFLRGRPSKWIRQIRMQHPPENNTPHETAPPPRRRRAGLTNPPTLDIESTPPVQEVNPATEEIESCLREEWRKRTIWVMNGAKLRNVPSK